MAMYRRWAAWGAWAASLACVIAPAGRAEPAGDARPAPVESPSAREAAQEMLAAVRALRSLKGETLAEWTITTRGEEARPQRMAAYELTIATEPGRFAIKGDDLEARCDGTTLWIYARKPRQYVERPLTEISDLEDTIHELTQRRLPVPFVIDAVMSPKASLDELIDGMVAVTGMSTGEAGGRPVRWISFAARDSTYDTDELVTLAIAVDQQTKLPVRLTVDMTAALRASLKNAGEDAEDARTPVRAVYASRLDKVTTNAEIMPSTFTFTPGEKDVKVDAIDFTQLAAAPERRRAGADPQLALLGREVPAFHGEQLDGTKLDIKDLRGRVVLLDFWATWCGPCVRAIPHIQEVHEHFAGKPVTVLGINRDRYGDEPKIKRFLEKTGITFDHVLDFGGDIAAAFAVTGIPTTVLIDANGTVQSVEMGFMPGHEKKLIARIDRLLAGESLVNAAEVEARELLAQEAGREEIFVGGERPVTFREINPEVLTAATALRMGFLGFGSGRGDLDGDGRDELLLCDVNGTLVADDGSQPRAIRLRGMGSDLTARSLAVMKDGDERRLLIGSVRFTGAGHEPRASAAAYSVTGERLWGYTPMLDDDLSSEIAVDAGDLDGDGKDEAVLAIFAYGLRPQGDNVFVHTGSAGSLVVIDSAGKVIAQKQMPMTMPPTVKVWPARDGKPGSVTLTSPDGLQRVTFNSAPTPAAAP